jgi:ABC-type transport system involved in multi-copper enzyme maturation permease subunit
MSTAILARLALLEARRSGLVWLAAAAVFGAVALGGFLAQVSITEARLLQAAVVAALLRWSAVFLVAAQVVASVRREIDDRRLELSLALPIPRSRHYLGRLAGFALCGLVLACLFAAPLLLWAAPAAVGAWAVSLALELMLVAAAALFFAMSLASPVSALFATAGLYVLSRAMTAMQAIAGGPLAEDSPISRLARHAIDGLALLLPALDAVTRTEWLLYGLPDLRTYIGGLVTLAVYVALLAAAGVFDFQRRSA